MLADANARTIAPGVGALPPFGAESVKLDLLIGIADAPNFPESCEACASVTDA